MTGKKIKLREQPAANEGAKPKNGKPVMRTKTALKAKAPSKTNPRDAAQGEVIEAARQAAAYLETVQAKLQELDRLSA